MSLQRKQLIRIVQLVCIMGCVSFAGCVWFAAAAKTKPDLLIKTIREQPGTTLKMGNKNIIEVTVRNRLKTDAGASVTNLEIREGRKKPNGRLLLTYRKKTPAIPGNAQRKMVFRWVAIPQTEQPAWYTLVAIADANNKVDEFKEDNNKKHTSRFVDQ